MRPALRRTAAPSASIVIPTHNAWDWTRRALEAVSAHTAPPYEVIVCDNASSDGTTTCLSEMDDIRVVLNRENLGFGIACNQGAALARAPYVVFLNSDAVVHENWLGPLLGHLAATPRVGAVGPLLLNTDGSIQAAGSTVAGDGWPVDHRGPRQDYGFPMAVDYVAGACLATRRASFHEIGGFDPSYGLAYYEDVDLCYRLRAAGYRIVLEPGSVVTHARGVSSDREQRRRFLTDNRSRFVARWRHELAGRPTSEESRNLPPVRLRDLSCDARLLVLTGSRSDWCRDLVARLASGTPNVRVTVLGPTLTDLPVTVERIAVADRAAVLRDRRFHYDVILTRDGDDCGQLRAVLDETQPQARRIDAAADADAVCTALAGAGVDLP